MFIVFPYTDYHQYKQIYHDNVFGHNAEPYCVTVLKKKQKLSCQVLCSLNTTPNVPARQCERKKHVFLPYGYSGEWIPGISHLLNIFTGRVWTRQNVCLWFTWQLSLLQLKHHGQQQFNTLQLNVIIKLAESAATKLMTVMMSCSSQQDHCRFLWLQRLKGGQEVNETCDTCEVLIFYIYYVSLKHLRLWFDSRCKFENFNSNLILKTSFCIKKI